MNYGAGYAAFSLGRTDAAISYLKHAIDANPRFVQAMVLLAQIAYQSADLDLAVSSLEKAAAIAPQDRALAQRLDQWRREAALHNRFEMRSTERFKVSFEGAAEKAIGDRIAVILESAYWRIGKAMSTYPSETLNVILYTNRQFQDITRAPAWAGGGYDGRIRLPVNGALRSPKTLERVVTHEFVHAVIHNAAGESVPTWVNEGLASYLESSDRALGRRTRFVGRTDASTSRILSNGFGQFDSAIRPSLPTRKAWLPVSCSANGSARTLGPFLQMLGNGHTVDQALSTDQRSARAVLRRVAAPNWDEVRPRKNAE